MVVGDVYVIWQQELDLLPCAPPESPEFFAHLIRWKSGTAKNPIVCEIDQFGRTTEHVALVVDAQHVRVALAYIRSEALHSGDNARKNALDFIIASFNAAERALDSMTEVL